MVLVYEINEGLELLAESMKENVSPALVNLTFKGNLF